MWRGIGAVLGGWLVGAFWFAACFGRFLGELVVHSTEWTTGAGLFLVFGLVLAFSRDASGPLDGVVHWLGTLHRFWLGFGGCLESFLLLRRLT